MSCNCREVSLATSCAAPPPRAGASGLRSRGGSPRRMSRSWATSPERRENLFLSHGFYHLQKGRRVLLADRGEGSLTTREIDGFVRGVRSSSAVRRRSSPLDCRAWREPSAGGARPGTASGEAGWRGREDKSAARVRWRKWTKPLAVVAVVVFISPIGGPEQRGRPNARNGENSDMRLLNIRVATGMFL